MRYASSGLRYAEQDWVGRFKRSGTGGSQGTGCFLLIAGCAALHPVYAEQDWVGRFKLG